MSDDEALVAIYDTPLEAERAIKALQESGFDIEKISVVGKEYHSEDHVIGCYSSGDRMKYWGEMGAFWGGIWELLSGGAFFVIPDLGPVLIAGPLAASIVGALKGVIVVGGLSAVGAGLHSIGIPNDSVLTYETAIKGDRFILLACGTATELTRAQDIIQTTHAVDSDLHDLRIAHAECGDRSASSGRDHCATVSTRR